MFSGPDGTWASLTSARAFAAEEIPLEAGSRWTRIRREGQRDLPHSEGCVIVNPMFFGCTLGKEKVHGDMFKDMRLYFDEQRLPPMDEGNGQP